MIVTDGILDYSAGSFGLSRFVEAISQAVTSPIITLAHRSQPSHSVTIGGTSYAVLGNFLFTMISPDIYIGNFDQIWLFGFRTHNEIGNMQPLAAAEIKKIAQFMNAGGGVFATGDHKTLGQAMGGLLPRIRHMRDWSSVPMGTEWGANARNRIDTVVDPGSDQTYQFEDQGDHVPQRIYPNYKVTWGTSWTATIHPLLQMPGTPVNRIDASGFTNDIDVMPDHPHESVCFDASNYPSSINGVYTIAGLSFAEFPLTSAGARITSDIVAYAVSGGRSVYNNAWKPPVNPRMFGIISALDGHAATPYSGNTARPGRIVCDSTWHHFVNVNLDGTGSGNTGLSAPALQKVHRYYLNAIDWLQPLNRRLCWYWLYMMWVRFHPALFEELTEAPALKYPQEFEGVGLDAMRILDAALGSGKASEAVRAVLRQDSASESLVDGADAEAIAQGDSEERMLAYIFGKGLVHVANATPSGDPAEIERLLAGKRHIKFEKDLARITVQASAEAVELQLERTQSRLNALSNLHRPKKKARPGRD